MSEITQEALKKLLHYDPDTGLFTWIRKPSKHSSQSLVGRNTGYTGAHGYVYIGLSRKQHRAHQLAFLYMTGSNAPDQVDHINHDRSDNRWENLRAVSRVENLRNQSKYSNNKSGFTGVYYRKSCKKWYAQIGVNGCNTRLGTYECITAAILSRKSAEVAYGFHANHGNN